MIEEIKQKVCIACGKCKELKGDCYLAKNVASILIGTDYRKIPDGAVVLTKEEYAEIKNVLKVSHSYMVKETYRLGQARKETAREIFNKLLNLCYDDDHPRGSVAAGEIRYIAKREYGVEVDE